MKNFKAFLLTGILVLSSMSMFGCQNPEAKKVSETSNYTKYTITNYDNASLKMYKDETFSVSGSYNYSGEYHYSGNYNNHNWYNFYDTNGNLVAQGYKTNDSFYIEWA